MHPTRDRMSRARRHLERVSGTRTMSANSGVGRPIGAALRHCPQDGENNNGAKLTEFEVKQIKELSAAGVRQCEIMRKIGVTRSNVWAILRGKSWAHVA